MRKYASFATALVLAFATVSAQAMPIPVAPPNDASPIGKAAYGCGPNGTRGPYGHCRARFTCLAAGIPDRAAGTVTATETLF